MKSEFFRETFLKSNRELFLTDGGLETSLIYIEKLDLPEFASFPLLKQSEGKKILTKYYRNYRDLAQQFSLKIILDSPTWRANSVWGKKLGYGENEIKQFNRLGMELLNEIQKESPETIIKSGCLGPLSDGYHAKQIEQDVDRLMKLHRLQIEALVAAGTDVLSALTLTYWEEAAAISLLAKEMHVPAIISFTVETDGLLPSGDSIDKAIQKVDQLTDCYPSIYMINCAHPLHFRSIFLSNNKETERIKGIRVNASTKSHQELDQSTTLDSGNPHQLAIEVADLRNIAPQLTVFGGCCGTGLDHATKIAKAITESQD